MVSARSDLMANLRRLTARGLGAERRATRGGPAGPWQILGLSTGQSWQDAKSS